MQSAAGKVIAGYLLKNLPTVDANTIIVQSEAAAQPLQDTAPVTGAPHEDESTFINPPSATVSNDNGFHWHNKQTMADVANEQMRDGHGSTGASYDNDKR